VTSTAPSRERPATNPAAPARHAGLRVLSNEALSPAINWTTLGPPLLGPLATRSGGRLVAPPPLRGGSREAWRGCFGALRGADAVFWMQMSARPEPPVWLAAACAPRARRAALVVDAWRPSLTKIGALAVAQRLDPCFVAMREGCDELRRRFPRGSFTWLPFGVDTDVFHDRGGERDIFAYWMGRRHDPLHRALDAYCASRGLIYRHTSGGEVTDPDELGRLVSRSRYFVVTPPDLDDPVRTGGFSPLVMRYLEGLAGGARLLGVPPRSGELEDLVPVGGMLSVAADGRALAERIDADLADPTVGATTAHAAEVVRARHSWTVRADQILEVLAR
jgi:hypothetical protein